MDKTKLCLFPIKKQEQTTKKSQEIQRKDIESPPVEDLRELINREKELRSKRAKALSQFRNEDALSVDSFHSFSTPNYRKEYSTSHAQDFVNSLGNDYVSDEQKICILNKLLNLPIKLNIKMAQGTKSYLKSFFNFFLDSFKNVGLWCSSVWNFS